MIKNSVTSSSSGKGIDKLKEDFKKLLNLDVLVGIPEDKAPRKKNKINNAQLLFIHTNGSELRHIPRRPVIEPAIKDGQDKIQKELATAATLVLNGNIQQAKIQLQKVGMLGSNLARAWFTNPKNGWKENSPATIAEKGSDRPLIDTGELRKSIIFVVRDKKS